MNAPMTEENILAWRGMVAGGMNKEVMIDRLADWARMLEERISELDPLYYGYPWGRRK